MPFGFTNTPGLLTLLIKETSRPLREIGIAVTLMAWFWPRPKGAAIHKGSYFEAKLESLGWKINWEKCQWDPQNLIIYIGFLVNLKEKSLEIPEDRLEKLRGVMLSAIRELEKSGEIKLRKVAKVMGVLVSVKKAWSPAMVSSRAGFRTLQQVQKASWGTKVTTDPQLLEDLILTTKLLATGGKRLIQHTEKVTEVWSDALPTGWACAIQELEARGVWVGEEVELSTNRRELLGFWRGLLSLEKEVRGKVLKWIEDNTTSIIWFWKGARDASVGQLVKQMWV
jgi:hypothetical protein